MTDGYAVSLYRAAGTNNPQTSKLIDTVEVTHEALCAAIGGDDGDTGRL